MAVATERVVSKEDAVSEQEPTCAHCAAPLTGPFCARCGQPLRPDRLRMGHVIRHVAAQAFALDRGLARTTWDALRRPGVLIRNYLRGVTVPYLSPVRFFLLWATVAQLLFLWTGAVDDAASGFIDGLDSEGGDPAAVADIIGQFYVIGTAAFIPFAALWSRLLLSASRHNLAEHFVFYLYTFGGMMLFWTLGIVTSELPIPEIMLGPKPLDYYAGMSFLVFVFVYYGWAAARFFRCNVIWSVLGSLLAFALSFVSTIFVATILSQLLGIG